MRAAFVDILETRGIRGLYSGLSPTLVEIVPYAGLQFGTYDTFKRWAMVCSYPRFSLNLCRTVKDTYLHLDLVCLQFLGLEPSQVTKYKLQ